MDFDREYPAGCVAGRQPDIYPEPVIPGWPVKNTELLQPGVTFDVTICIGDYRDKDWAPQLVFQ
jgi:hypothetical protein